MKSTINKSAREIINDRMIELMEYSIHRGIVADRMEWCERIGFNYANFSQVANYKQGFTDEHKRAAVKLAGADLNWLFGLADQMILPKNKPDPVAMIEEGLRIIKAKNNPGKTKKNA